MLARASPGEPRCAGTGRAPAIGRGHEQVGAQPGQGQHDDGEGHLALGRRQVHARATSGAGSGGARTGPGGLLAGREPPGPPGPTGPARRAMPGCWRACPRRAPGHRRIRCPAPAACPGERVKAPPLPRELGAAGPGAWARGAAGPAAGRRPRRRARRRGPGAAASRRWRPAAAARRKARTGRAVPGQRGLPGLRCPRATSRTPAATRTRRPGAGASMAAGSGPRRCCRSRSPDPAPACRLALGARARLLCVLRVGAVAPRA